MPSLSLNIKALQLLVNLGVPEEERIHKQIVTIDLAFTFPQGCQGMQTDQLADTLCYYTFYQQLQAYCQNRSFHLIEYLAKQLYDFIIQHYSHITLQEITVHKNPPVSQIGEASVTLRNTI